MAGRFSRSWQIFKSSITVLNQNKKLLVFPLLSSVAALIVMASFAATYFWWEINSNATSSDEASIVDLMILFAAYLVLYGVIFFFNTALIAAVAKYLDGSEPTIGDGLRVAWSKVGTILGYAFIAATVGMLLQALEERVGFIGRIVVGLLGFAWTAATFLVVPVLVHRDIGPLDAVKESAALLKETWGENIIANVGMGVFFTLFYIPLVLVVAVTGAMVFYNASMSGFSISDWIITSSVLAVALLTLLLLGLIHATLQSIYGAALYRYATNAHDESGASYFAPELLGAAFSPKGK